MLLLPEPCVRIWSENMLMPSEVDSLQPRILSLPWLIEIDLYFEPHLVSLHGLNPTEAHLLTSCPTGIGNLVLVLSENHFVEETQEAGKNITKTWVTLFSHKMYSTDKMRKFRSMASGENKYYWIVAWKMVQGAWDNSSEVKCLLFKCEDLSLIRVHIH